MSATKARSVLETLELDAATIESLPEPALSELIGFLEDGSRRRRGEDELLGDRGRLALDVEAVN
jgi:hypothetical protein